MQGVITRVQVLAHPVVIFESFGVKVLWRALFADAKETFLEIVRRSAEEEAHRGMVEFDLSRTVRRFIGFECRVRDVYRRLSQVLADAPDAARFFAILAGHEEGHAIVLSRVQREIARGRLWKKSREVHLGDIDDFEARLAVYEAEASVGVTLGRALDIVDGIESSELNVVFDTLNGSVDMRSRARFERFFVMTQRHLAYCSEQVGALRARYAAATTRSA